MAYQAENRGKQMDETRIQQKLQQLINKSSFFTQKIEESRQILPRSQQFEEIDYNGEQEKALEGRDFTVCIRARPLLKHELQKQYFEIVTANNPDMVVHNSKLNVKLQPVIEDQSFNVDYAFGPKDNNEIVYNYTGRPLIRLALDGGLGAIFAYGQTGSGKTFTMQGIQKQVAFDVFKFNQQGHNIFVGFFELLGNKASCLLDQSNKVDILEDKFGKVQAKGVKEVQVSNGNQFLELVNQAQANRKTQATFKNDVSSRTHSICQVRIQNTRVPSAEDGYLYMIDLVGSENASDSQFHDKALFKETKDINKSLMALKECIRNRALASVDSKYIHVPFRQSKLTLLLKDSFDMDSFRQTKTVVIANIAPGIADKEQTINTVRYAAPIKVCTKNKKPQEINPNNPQFWDNEQLKEYMRKVTLKYNKKVIVDMNQFLPFETGKQALMMSEADFISRLESFQYPEKNAKQVHDQFFKKFIDNRFADRKKLLGKAGKIVQPLMDFKGKHDDNEKPPQEKPKARKSVQVIKKEPTKPSLSKNNLDNLDDYQPPSYSKPPSSHNIGSSNNVNNHHHNPSANFNNNQENFEQPYSIHKKYSLKNLPPQIPDQGQQLSMNRQLNNNDNSNNGKPWQKYRQQQRDLQKQKLQEQNSSKQSISTLAEQGQKIINNSRDSYQEQQHDGKQKQDYMNYQQQLQKDNKKPFQIQDQNNMNNQIQTPQKINQKIQGFSQDLLHKEEERYMDFMNKQNNNNIKSNNQFMGNRFDQQQSNPIKISPKTKLFDNDSPTQPSYQQQQFTPQNNYGQQNQQQFPAYNNNNFKQQHQQIYSRKDSYQIPSDQQLQQQQQQGTPQRQKSLKGFSQQALAQEEQRYQQFKMKQQMQEMAQQQQQQQQDYQFYNQHNPKQNFVEYGRKQSMNQNSQQQYGGYNNNNYDIPNNGYQNNNNQDYSVKQKPRAQWNKQDVNKIFNNNQNYPPEQQQQGYNKFINNNPVNQDTQQYYSNNQNNQGYNYYPQFQQQQQPQQQKQFQQIPQDSKYYNF